MHAPKCVIRDLRISVDVGHSEILCRQQKSFDYKPRSPRLYTRAIKIHIHAKDHVVDCRVWWVKYRNSKNDPARRRECHRSLQNVGDGDYTEEEEELRCSVVMELLQNPQLG